MQEETPHYLGHRLRLRQKLLAHGANVLPDYELLELLLTIAQPRRDVKPLAKDLLTRFGSFAKVIQASEGDLMTFPGVKETTIATFKIVQGTLERILKEEVKNQPIIGSWDRLLDYCKVSMGHLQEEQFRLIFLDSKNKLIADEIQQKGTVNHTPLYPREVVKRALELSTTSVIMIHNHPSGDATPSRTDVEMTHQVRDALKTVCISLHDHLVIARNKYVSFKAMGLL